MKNAVNLENQNTSQPGSRGSRAPVSRCAVCYDRAIDPAATKTWRAVPDVDGVWCADRVVHGVPLRALAIRLTGGRLAIHSPIRGLGRQAHGELAGIGVPAFLIAPNHFHNLGLREYAAEYPGVIIVASATAVRRVKRLCRREVQDESALRGELPAGVSVLVPPGTRAGELWLSIDTPAGRAWTVGDAFFNIARTPPTPIGLLLRLLGISPGLRIGTSFRWLVRDRAGYRRWVLAALTAQQPTTLIPCHGDILTDASLADRLIALVERRL
jgi:hypothetical protein